jgi:hypothetical protein
LKVVLEQHPAVPSSYTLQSSRLSSEAPPPSPPDYLHTKNKKMSLVVQLDSTIENELAIVRTAERQQRQHYVRQLRSVLQQS